MYLVLAALGMSHFGLAQRLSYECEIVCHANPGLDPQKEASDLATVLERSGMSPELVERNRQSLPGQFSRLQSERNGTGPFVIEFGEGFSTCAWPVVRPDGTTFTMNEATWGGFRASGEGQGSMALWPGAETQFGPWCFDHVVFLGAPSAGATQADQRRSGEKWVTVFQSHDGSRATETTTVVSDTTDVSTWVSVERSHAGNVVRRAERSPSGIRIITLRPSGERGMTYELRETGRGSAGQGIAWDKFVQVGDRVSDKRLGMDANVGYLWSGSLPSLDELRAMEGESTATASPWWWIGAAFLAVGSFGAWRHRSGRTSADLV